MPAAVAPHVVAETPRGWVDASVAPPKIAESAGAQLTSFHASASPAHDAALVAGCVATPIPGWVEDMRPVVEGRTVALAGAAAERAMGAPVDARPDGATGFELRAASNLGGPTIGTARTFVGFDRVGSGHVFTCFAACVQTGPATKAFHGSGVACERSVAEAYLAGTVAPPGPGLALRAVTWAVHHPDAIAQVGAVLLVGLSIAAVVTRRRPRSVSSVPE